METSTATKTDSSNTAPSVEIDQLEAAYRMPSWSGVEAVADTGATADDGASFGEAVDTFFADITGKNGQRSVRSKDIWRATNSTSRAAGGRGAGSSSAGSSGASGADRTPSDGGKPPRSGGGRFSDGMGRFARRMGAGSQGFIFEGVGQNFEDPQSRKELLMFALAGSAAMKLGAAAFPAAWLLPAVTFSVAGIRGARVGWLRMDGQVKSLEAALATSEAEYAKLLREQVRLNDEDESSPLPTEEGKPRKTVADRLAEIEAELIDVREKRDGFEGIADPDLKTGEIVGKTNGLKEDLRLAKRRRVGASVGGAATYVAAAWGGGAFLNGLNFAGMTNTGIDSFRQFGETIYDPLSHSVNVAGGYGGSF